MSVTVLEKKLQSIPQKYFNEISDYFDYLLFKADKESASDSVKNENKIEAFEKLIGVIPNNIKLSDEKT